MAEMGQKLTGVKNNYIYIYIWDIEITFDVPAKLHFVWIGKEIPKRFPINIWTTLSHFRSTIGNTR